MVWRSWTSSAIAIGDDREATAAVRSEFLGAMSGQRAAVAQGPRESNAAPRAPVSCGLAGIQSSAPICLDK